MALTFMQTIKGKKVSLKNGLFKLNFGDTRQMKNHPNTISETLTTLKMELIRNIIIYHHSIAMKLKKKQPASVV